MADIKAWPNFAAAIKCQLSGTLTNAFKIRATGFNINAKQEITTPELIDGAVDMTGYGLQGIMVDGDVTFPLFHEGSSLGTGGAKSSCSPFTHSMAGDFWQIAAERESNGRLKNSAVFTVAYPDNSQFAYDSGYLNTLNIKVSKGGFVDCTTNWICREKIDQNNWAGNPDVATGLDETPAYLSPSRIISWNDFVITLNSVSGDSTARIGAAVSGEGMTDFNVTLNNNIDRAFTFNGSLFPQDVFAKKRVIEGSLKLLGRSKYLNKMGLNNANYYTSFEKLAFGYKLGTSNTAYWATALHGILMKPEEMSLSPNEVFETTLNFRAAGDCAAAYESTEMGIHSGISLSDNGNGLIIQMPTPAAGGTGYGNKTRAGFESGNTGTPTKPYEGW